MLRRLYDWTIGLAAGKNAIWALAFIAFIEASIFPIPPDILLIPMVLAAPHRAWRIAAIATVASVLGGLLGYYIGYGLFETVGQPVLEFYGKTEKFEHFAARYNELGVWAVLVAGLTPFPFKVITIASGVTGMALVPFIAASIVARSARFFIVAALLRRYGEPIRDFIEKRLGLVFIVFCALLIGGFLLVGHL